ncbi:MAG: DUF11 domain-containing protein [Geminocystis sp.]|nr:DUF11 domain-containing protein [Geminocystis sp.]
MRIPWKRWLLLLSCLIYLLVQVLTPTAPSAAQGTPVEDRDCIGVGKDGGGGVGGIVNTYYAPATTQTINAGSTTIPLGTMSPIGSNTPIQVGDLILIMQMQGADIDSSNTYAYGDGVGGDGDAYEPPAQYPGGTMGSASIPSPSSNAASGYTNINNAGLYEYAIVTGVSGSNINIKGGGPGGGLINTYVNAPATSTQGKRTYQIIRVPQYTNITLNSANPLRPAPWNGQVGGVLAIDVAGTLNMIGGVVIEASGTGFRGGSSRRLSGGGGINTDFRTLSTVNNNGSKGEGIAGTPRYVLNYFDPFNLDGAFNPPIVTRTDTLIEGYPNGSHGRGAPGNAGGGSTDGRPSANDENSGGGGGGNGGAGGMGGRAWNSQAPSGGFGGASLAGVINGGQRLFMGGGGGGGTTNNASRSTTRPASFSAITNSMQTTDTANGIYSSGGAGGGIIMVRTGRVSGTGIFRSRGAPGLSSGQDGAGGGGAGGTVYVVATDPSNISNIAADVRGGDGGWSTFPQAHGPGGGGGGGVVVSTNAGVSIVPGGLDGGQAGKAGPTNNADATNGTHGARAGTGLTAPLTAVGNYGTPPTALCKPRVLLVKRITAVNGDSTGLTSFVDDPTDPNDNSPSWPTGYIKGRGTDGTLQVKPGDTLDYTIYFVNAGVRPANNVRVCDAIPPNTEFVPDTYNGLTPTDGGVGADYGIALAIGSNTPTAYLTNVADSPDRGQYYPPGQVPPNCVDINGNPITSNPNGVVTVDITRTTGSPSFPSLPANTTTSSSSQNYGFVRFRVRVK